MTTLEALLETWRRNTQVISNILRAMPEGGIDAKDTGGQWTVAHHLADMQGGNVYWLEQSSPKFAAGLQVLYTEDASVPEGFIPERNIEKIINGFETSSEAVARAVQYHLETNEPFGSTYANPIFFLQHMLWHQAYHTGQIMWALKQSGMRFSDDQASELIWKVLRA